MINEAHYLERKSEDAARRGLFDEAIHCCVAAIDCLTRLLNEDSEKQQQPSDKHSDDEKLKTKTFVLRDPVRDSILAQRSQLEVRRKQLTMRKKQFNLLKEILMAQQRRKLQQTESQSPTPYTDEEQPVKQRRGSTVRRRLSNKGATAAENRRKSGCVEAANQGPAVIKVEMVEEKGKRDESKQESFSLLDNSLGNLKTGIKEKEGENDGANDQAVDDELEKLRQLEVDDLSWLAPTEKDKSAALEASLYEMSMYPSRKEREAGRNRGRAEMGAIAANVGKEREMGGKGRGSGGGRRGERDVGKIKSAGRNMEKSIHRLSVFERVGDLYSGSNESRHVMRIHLPPLDPPPFDIPTLSPLDLPPLETPDFDPMKKMGKIG